MNVAHHSIITVNWENCPLHLLGSNAMNTVTEQGGGKTSLKK